MRLLLDTSALLWFLAGDERLSGGAADLISDPAREVFVSVVSLWEIAAKCRIGKLTADLREVVEAVPRSGFTLLELRPMHLVRLMALPVLADHRDPFDHLLIAQALAEGLTFVSDGRDCGRYPVQVVACRG